MAGKRWYNDGCTMSHALDLIGDRWALPIVRDLLLGPKRFTDLRVGLPSASPDMLSQRLRELQEAGIVWQHKLPPPAAAWVYELTSWGSDLSAVVVELNRWGARSPLLGSHARTSVDSLMLSMQAAFDARLAADVTTLVALRLNGAHFQVRVADGKIRLGRNEPEQPDLIFDTDPQTFEDLLCGNPALNEVVRSGTLKLTGPPSAAQIFLRLFPNLRTSRAEK